MFMWYRNWRRRQANRQKEDLLYTLSSLKRQGRQEFIGETQRRIEELESERLACVDAVLAAEGADVGPAVHGAVTAVLQHAEKLEADWAAAVAEKRQLREEIEASVEAAVAFIEHTSFYPPDFALDTNKLKGLTIDIDEALKEDPLLDIGYMREFKRSLESAIEQFQAAHKETLTHMEKLERKMKASGKQEPQALIEIKERLYRNLQYGRMDEVRRDIKKMRQEIKRL